MENSALDILNQTDRIQSNNLHKIYEMVSQQQNNVDIPVMPPNKSRKG